MLALPALIPRSTYRLQFTPEFDFAKAQKIIPYLAKLGISDVYASPIFQASAASTHGYDVNDYNRISASLGGREALEGFRAELRNAGMGLLIDFVPNHMGIDGEYNLWWKHVLENGVHSKFAPYFDIEWHPRLKRLQDRVLVPMLDDHYGAVLESGRLKLAYGGGLFFIHHGALKLPVRPRSYGMILEQMIDLMPSGDGRRIRLRELAEAFENLPTHDPDARDSLLENLRAEWSILLEADPSLAPLLEATLAGINGVPGDAVSFGKLHELLEQQHYRLAYWKVGAHEVNYRRFFAVDTLVGLKMEDPAVFTTTHRLLGDLIASNTITGIRLDHIDGLWNPAQYLQRLQELVGSRRPGGGTLYTLVEKIVASDEHVPDAWATHGTTGYEFAASLINLFLDQQDEPAWTEIYGDFTGEKEASLDLTYQDKLFALQEIFPNAVANLVVELDALIEPDWHWRDLSLDELETALRYLLACLPVYRTYRMPGEAMAEEEKKWLHHALEEVIRRNPRLDPIPVGFLVRVLTGEYPAPDVSPEQRSAFSDWVCKLQQATGAVMAKSVEDTHFYRYVRMVAANEVGNHPSRFGRPVTEFHEVNLWRLKNEPLCQLTTSTHDTKWSEDARARLFALAELPGEWRSRLEAWHAINQPAHQEIKGRMAPDAREEYLLYKALLAAWPLSLTVPDDTFRERMKAYFRKTQTESKLNTTWTYPHVEWQAAGDRFIDAILDSEKFLNDFLPFAQRIAERGMVFSLAQTVLKLTSPGVPDIYQGNEIWDFSLVDPDNRRPVDFDLRMALLDQMDKRAPEDLLRNWQDGGIKMQVTKTLLACRRDNPELFSRGGYMPLEPTGSRADQVVGFIRQARAVQLLVMVPRRLGLTGASRTRWSDTRVPIDEKRQWINLFANAPIKLKGGEVLLDAVFAEWPVAVLLST